MTSKDRRSAFRRLSCALALLLGLVAPTWAVTVYCSTVPVLQLTVTLMTFGVAVVDPTTALKFSAAVDV